MKTILASPLFDNIEQTGGFFHSFPLITFQKGEYIFLEGEQPKKFGVIVNGAVLIESTDYEGNLTILGKMEQGNIFGESYVLAQEPMAVNVRCERETKVLFIPADEIYQGNSPEAIQLRNNLITLLAKKNVNLSEKIFITAPKSLRKKILAYLQSERKKQNSQTITIPYNRQQMADYLGVDRSALSRELSSMKNDGMIDFCKNKFSLKK